MVGSSQGVMSMVWLLLVLMILGAASLDAAAHKPIAIGETRATRDEAVRVVDIDVSQVIYTEITPELPQSWLFVETDGAFDLYVSVGVPRIERLSGFRPALAVIGPGLPDIELPETVEVPDGAGAVLLRTSAIDEPDVFYEPVTGTGSWILLRQTVRLPHAGRYDVVAFSLPEGETGETLSGKLWMAIGVREKFGLRDILSLPRTMREVRAFHESPPRVSVSGWMRIAVLAAVIGIAVWALVRKG